MLKYFRVKSKIIDNNQKDFKGLMKFNTISIVYPNGAKIARGEKND